MIVDIRTYAFLQPSKMRVWLKLYEEHGWPLQKKYLGECLGFYTTYEGVMNKVVHLWRYESQADREARRGAMMQDPGWAVFLDKVAEAEIVMTQESSIARETPFFRGWMSMQSTAIIIAAGLGTRMKSALPKAAHKIAGREMLAHLIRAAAQVFDRIAVVVGPDMPLLEQIAAPHAVAVQRERLGTAHAARQAEPYFGEGPVAVFYADNPLVSVETMQALLARLQQGDAGLVLLGMTPPDAGRYGRLVTEGGYVSRIVEYADANEEERAIPFCNAGGMAALGSDMRDWLAEVGNANAKAEFYLTDIVGIARGQGVNVAALDAPHDECLGVNSRAELAQAEAAYQRRARARFMADGVTLQAPETVFFAADTEIGQDVVIGPHVVFGPGARVDSGAEIKAFSHLEGCHARAGAIIGPYARLRPGADVGEGAHVGNFVELKAAKLGKGAKANHLTYLGDAEIGPGANIGAGTITCNYDGKAKHKTKIGAKAFIGSNSALVAPVAVGDGALIAAGSVITEDVPEGALALGRARQVIKPRKG